MEATVLSPIIIGTRKWILEKRPHQMEAFLQEFPENEREYWTNEDLLPGIGIPASLCARIYDPFVKLWGEHAFRELAGSIALQDMGAFMRFFVKMGSPSLTIKMLPRAFRQYFNTGELKVLEVGSRSARIELVGTDVYGQAGCCGTQGWTARVLQHAGAKNPVASQPQCRFRGGSRCLIEISWE